MGHIGTAVHVPPIQPDWEMSPEDQGAGGQKDHNHHPLAATGPTPRDSTGDVLGAPSEAGPSQGSGDGPGNRLGPQRMEHHAIDCLSAYWESSSLQGPLSSDARCLIEMSWQPGTESSNKSCWRRWCRYARSHGVEELAPSLAQVIEYLTCLYNEGLKYNSINFHHSTLSGTLPPIQGFNVGEHPLVSCLLKGVFNCRPPKAKLFPSW